MNSYTALLSPKPSPRPSPKGRGSSDKLKFIGQEDIIPRLAIREGVPGPFGLQR